MTSVNVTTQSNTVTVQQGDATTVTIATQGPQGPAGAGSSDVVDDTSPQLGGDLASNGFDINFADSDNAVFGDGSDLKIFHNGIRSEINNATVNNFTIRQQFGNGYMFIHADRLQLRSHSTNEQYIGCNNNGSVELYHDNVKKVETTSTGITVTGTVTATSFVGDGTVNINNNGTSRIITGSGTANTLNANVNLTFDGTTLAVKNGNGVINTGAVKASTGILFGSDTADANTLDDYEEGTWTPTVLSEGNIDTSGLFTCTYTKIGRLVTINAAIHHLSDTTSSTFIKIGGLPYVPSGTFSTEHSAVCHGERYGGSATIVAYLLYNSGSWGISFRFGVPSGHYSGVRHSHISDDGTDNNLTFTLTYELV